MDSTAQDHGTRAQYRPCEHAGREDAPGTAEGAAVSSPREARGPDVNTWDWTGEYGLPGSPLRSVSLFIFVFRQAM